MTKRLITLLIVLTVLGAGVGYLAGPFVSRAHPRVQLAGRIAREEKLGLTERTLESEAYRETGEPLEALYAEARAVEGKVSLAAAIFGAWCGFVIALKAYSVMRERRRDIWEVDPSRCLACGRCFLSCPHERRRREKESASIAGKGA